MPRNKKGDCYEVHVRFLRDEVERDELDEWRLCHGTVTNAQGQDIGHCWLEHDGFVFDFSNGKLFKIEVGEYREMTKARDITVYTSEEVSINVIRHGHYGAWK